VLAEIVKAVQIRSLSYPSGLEHLPAVAEAVIEDIKNLSAK
jgi:hypothetical protein